MSKKTDRSDVVDWLLEEENPSVRYFTLTRLLGKKEDDPEAAKARNGIMRKGAVRKARGADGRWIMKNSFNGKMPVDVEEKGKPSKWITLRALLALGEGDS